MESLTNLKTGDIIFFKPKNLAGKIILWFINLGKKDKTPYSHVGKVVMMMGEAFFVEAAFNGVVLVYLKSRLNGLPKDSYAVFRPTFKIDIQQQKEIAFNLAGLKRYDYIALIHQAYRQITGRWMVKRNRFSTNAFYCSELVAYMDSKIFKNWYEVDPEDLYFSNWYTKLDIYED